MSNPKIILPSDLPLERHIVFGFFWLKFYLTESEEFVEQRKAQVADNFNRFAEKELPIEEIDPMRSMEYPRFLRASFTGLLTSFVETQMETVCDELGTRLRLAAEEHYFRQKDKRIGNLENSKRYICAHLKGHGRSLPWAPIEFLFRVRNCISHDRGDIGLMRNDGDKSELRKGKLKLVGDDDKKKGEVPVPGYSAMNDTIKLERAFGVWALHISFDFFKNLFSIMPKI